MKTMYSPSHYTEDRSDLIFEIISKYGFATVITQGANGPFVSHLPLILDSFEGRQTFNDQLDVRILTIDDWEQMIEIQVASSADHLSKAEWESFSRTQSERYLALEAAGFGHWYGGFFEGKLVAGLGIYHRDGLGRFQTVSTDPNFQRRGFCQTLVYLASQKALASGGIKELVMCADPDYHASKIYESVGFKRRALEHGVYWWDKNREPK